MGNKEIGVTIKKKFFAALLGGFILLTTLLATIGFTGTIFALPLGGMGDFYVVFDKLEGEDFTLNPHMGETGNAYDVPMVRNRIGKATIENLLIYKDLQMPTGKWIRINIKASEPTIIEGLIQDARFIDANLSFREMAIAQMNTSEMTAEEMYASNWSHDAETVTITDAEIVTDYLFQNMVSLQGAKISIEDIDEPAMIDAGTDALGKKLNGDAGGPKSNGDSERGSKHGKNKLPDTASNLYLPIIIGIFLLILGSSLLLLRARRVKDKKL